MLSWLYKNNSTDKEIKAWENVTTVIKQISSQISVQIKNLRVIWRDPYQEITSISEEIHDNMFIK